ncbi:methyltransferase domain-containing protein [Blastococcus saxobsidens]|uniref:Methyltransferase domain-containing protein n=1 Tax=Blastococcus saxobsidens TaxID=138336 RepID=A0A6L9W5B1_9ACTN|nr:methyltransferase domain-containing protein [Blastococcus saxobsidens]
MDPRAVGLLACQVCGASFSPEGDGAGVRCAAGHRVDRARQGHLSLLPPGRRPPAGDSAEMVADRVAFLSAGHYDGLSSALRAAVAPPDAAPPAALLDLGGGTGHHLARLLDDLPEAVGVVLDASPYAARRAARAHPRALAVVADAWARLPVLDGVADRVLVVFAPRNGPEIARVLRPGGRLVVVTPAPDHLAEIVGPLGLLRVDPDKAERLAATLEPHLTRGTASAHRWTVALERADIATLVGMGPHARHLTTAGLAAALARLPASTRLTISVDVATYARAR